MKQHELKPAIGARRAPKRVGRGIGSGMGKTSTRGHKGQWARSGGGVRLGFEGGQMPMARRLPKRGFNNFKFETRFATINVSDLNRFEDGAVVSAEILLGCGLVKKLYCGLKILGEGELNRKLTVQAAAFSKSAREKIEAKGGTVEVM